MRRFLRSKNRVENEEASIRARKLQKATTAKQRCGAAKPGPRSRRPHRGISRSEMPRPILRGKPKRRKGRTRPFRLRRSGTRPKGGRRGAPPRRTLTPPVHRARRSCCRRRRARPVTDAGADRGRRKRHAAPADGRGKDHTGPRIRQGLAAH